jgi:hypothetical protein
MVVEQTIFQCFLRLSMYVMTEHAFNKNVGLDVYGSAKKNRFLQN